MMIRLVSVGATLAALVAAQSANASMQRSVTPQVSARALIAPHGVARTSAGTGYLHSQIECTARGNPSRDVFLDCDDAAAPNDEQHIVVDPKNSRHMIASANDYDSAGDEFYTTFDGGRTWVTGDMSLLDDTRTGSDPVTAIDPRTNTAIHSSLNYQFTDAGESTNGHVVVSLSRDGGLHWGKPVIVYRGHGADSDPVQVFNDKPWVYTDTNPASPYYGRTYLTWSRFLAHNGAYVESPIWESHSDDGGQTWSNAHEISGSSRTCTFQEAGAALQCDEDQGSVITTTADGSVYVAFENGQHEAAWEPGEQFESQYMVVRSTDGGTTFGGPVRVADLEDGTRDFPLNADDRSTLTGYQLRIPTYGNITASPLDGTLYVTFTDNRAGRHDVDNPVTDTNVFIAWSRDHGRTWHSPVPVTRAAGDQWFPSAAVDPTTGKVGVLYNTRGATNGTLFNAELSEGAPGSWTRTTLSQRPSNPRNSLVFQAGVPGCLKCALFHGDYITLAYGRDGSANAAWTDHRRFIDLGNGDDGFTQNTFFARR
jgi:hypothetical protein